VQQAGLSLNAGCWQNSPAEKEVIIGWILVGDHSVKDNKWFLGYAHTNIQYLNHVNPSK